MTTPRPLTAATGAATGALNAAAKAAARAAARAATAADAAAAPPAATPATLTGALEHPAPAAGPDRAASAAVAAAMAAEITRLAALAALAPSSHNCQPWRLVGFSRAQAEAQGPPAPPNTRWSRQLLVCLDRRRTLSALPALEREMRMSVGGFAGVLLNLLRLAGFGVRPRFIEPGWRPAGARGRARLEGAEPVLALYLADPPADAAPRAHPLPHWLAQRQTLRGPYRGAPLPPPTGACLPYRLDLDGRLAWHHVGPGPLLQRLCAFYRHHAPRDFRHGAAWRETYRHLRFADAAPGDDGLGMDIRSLFGPLPPWRRRLWQGLLHPAAIRLLGPLGLYARIGRDFEALLRGSAGIVYLSGEPAAADDEPRQHLLAGECVADLWLGATRDGQALHPLSVALQHPDIERELRALLGCEQPILFIARTGQPLQPQPPAPRRRQPPQAFCALDFDTPPTEPPPC